MAGVCLPAIAAAQTGTAPSAWEASRNVDENDMVTTGVAKGRDRLDSATSTSAIKENEIAKLGQRSLAELLRNMPGIRVEAAAGEGGNGYTVRGLPMVSSGAKYLQLQEDGLPVMQFGDLLSAQPDYFTRADFNIAQIESIRGGSSSTFASNAPGGVINLISKTGEAEGGSVQASTGLDFGSDRIDFDYGGRLGEGWRFHVGGFYRAGEGPRRTGFEAYRGGQVKFNVTRSFDGGHIRFYGKMLDDHTPGYSHYPVAITGTNDDPTFKSLPGFSITRDTLFSRYIPENVSLQPDGSVARPQYRDGYHAKARTGGVEAQVTLAGWTIVDRFRYSDMKAEFASIVPILTLTQEQLAATVRLPAPVFTYAAGPAAGARFDPARGAGLLVINAPSYDRLRNLGSVVNDLRASRVWAVDQGDLTTTVGIYRATQSLDRTATFSTSIQDVAGDGRSYPVNIAAAGGLLLLSQGGFFGYSVPGGAPSYSTDVRLRYGIVAPYGSFNYARNGISVGGSLRYDRNHVEGDIVQARAGCFDVDRNGTTTANSAECNAAVFPAGQGIPVDYSHGYLSYSAGVNVRVAEPFAVFARYSLGGRAAGDAILFSPVLSRTDGHLLNSDAGHDSVRQAEAGLKYRKGGITLNLTGFHARTTETNLQVNQTAAGDAQRQLVSRGYRAYGVEFEGSARRGPFAVTASGTLVDAKITRAEDSALVGNKPRHQPTLIYQLTPQYSVDRVTVGANVVGVTGSFAQDVNQLRLPAYTTVGLFLQVRPVDRLELGINATNVFNAMAITETLNATVPATNVGLARTLYGRLVSASVRVFF